MAVVIESARPDRPAPRPGIGPPRAAADYVGPVHFPDRGLAGARVLPQNVGKAVVIEVARSDSVPTRPGIGAHGPACDHLGPVHSPDRGLPIGAPKKDAVACLRRRRARRDKAAARDLEHRTVVVEAAG